MAARGRVIHKALTKSDRFNRALESGTLAPLVYVLTYLHADDWGHLPWDPLWIKRECLPDIYATLADNTIPALHDAMCVLAEVGLWEHVYQAGSKRYVYIYNFDTFSAPCLRFRRKGLWPDESGHIPTRGQNETTKASIDAARSIRTIVRAIPLEDLRAALE